MQSKISAFFRSTPDSSSPNNDHDLSTWENQQHHIINTYTRRRVNPNPAYILVRYTYTFPAEFSADYFPAEFSGLLFLIFRINSPYPSRAFIPSISQPLFNFRVPIADVIIRANDFSLLPISLERSSNRSADPGYSEGRLGQPTIRHREVDRSLAGLSVWLRVDSLLGNDAFVEISYCRKNTALSTWFRSISLVEWVGWVKSHFRGLLLQLEVTQRFCDPNPTGYVDSEKTEPNVVFY
ncbi:hypothetical protein V8G54_013003 [Vigna mungo]|uniref:Uncharacterized protein n=1 Tax=Vigna mungo TaxID=3915 RepID=A0AAQ3S2V4_VIGMU